MCFNMLECAQTTNVSRIAVAPSRNRCLQWFVDSTAQKREAMMQNQSNDGRWMLMHFGCQKAGNAAKTNGTVDGSKFVWKSIGPTFRWGGRGCRTLMAAHMASSRLQWRQIERSRPAGSVAVLPGFVPSLVRGLCGWVGGYCLALPPAPLPHPPPHPVPLNRFRSICGNDPSTDLRKHN